MYELAKTTRKNFEAPSIRTDLSLSSGPYMLLMAEAVRLARSDLNNPRYSEDATAFLTGKLVRTFSETLGYEGSFLGERTRT